jgi:hypothetical protein
MVNGCLVTDKDNIALFDKMVPEETMLRNRQTRNKNCLLRPCLLTDRHKMNILYRELPIDASY